MAFVGLLSRLIRTCVLLSLVAHFTAALTLGSSTVWETSTTSPEAVQPTATTLITDEKLQCDFENLQSLVDRIIGINRTSYNISMLVDTCPEVCELVYGAGNPDISGVGAVISYTLQGVSSLIFGPALGLLSLYLGSNMRAGSWLSFDPERLWVAKFFLPVARSIHKANIITAFSVLLAAVLRISGDIVPIGERQFLSTLARFEILTCWVCTLSFLPLHKSSKLEKLALGTYILATLILWLIASYRGGSFSVLVMETIGSACVDNTGDSVGSIILQLPTPSGFESSSIPASSTAPHIPLKGGSVFEVTGIVLGSVIAALLMIPVVIICGVLGFALFFILLLGLTGLAALSQLIYLQSAELLGVGPQRMGALTIAFSLGSTATIFIWWLIGDLLRLRGRLQDLAGSGYEDNDWGFGQITAVMTWTPVLQETIFAIIREYLSSFYLPQHRQLGTLLPTQGGRQPSTNIP